MSGCCGQGPVIVSGAAAPRVDVETQLMCDVLPDGTVAANVLVEPIYDTNSGARVATRFTDPATGDPYTPVGEIRACPVSPDCQSPTTPVTSVGLCLADGTPIAVTVVRDCTGAVTSEGWINLSTGAWSAGAVPAGTVACGESRSIQVSGTFCDVDDATGDVLGLVLVEYTYDDTGAIASVRLVDAVTGSTYTPTGTVTVCPAGVEQPERDVVQLCDTATDGTVTEFIRDYARDENGAIVGHADYGLDGTPYTPTGSVAQCATPPAECAAAAVQAFRLCDLNPAVTPNDDGLRCATPFLRHFVYACDGTATFHDTAMDGVTPYTAVNVVECGENPPSLREQVWNTVSVAQDATNPLVFNYTVANSEDSSQTGTVKMTASKAFGGGCGGTATAPVWNGPVTFTFEPDASVLALADVLRVDALDWDSWEDKVVTPAPTKVESDLGHSLNPGNRWHTAADNNTGHFYFNGPPTSVQMTNRNDGGGLACLAPAFGFVTLVPGPPCGVLPEVDHIVQPLCDVAAAGTTPFLRHWTVDNSSGQLTRIQDTTLDGTTAYTVAGTATLCGQNDTPVLTGVRRVTASTTVQSLKTEFPGLQSVTLTVLTGSVNVGMSNGTNQALPAGASATWSVRDTDDSSLAAAAFAGATGSDYFLVWTYKATAAG